MEIKSAEFIKGIRGTDNILNDKKFHIAFIGRSNVGKSSVINSLAKRKKMVKSSSLPGKTREINFFIINDKFYFVDLPGYGFAKIKEKQREKLRRLILWYLLDEELLEIRRKIILIIDFKVGPSKFDLEMLQLLQENNFDFVVIANKVDKIGKSNRIKQTAKIREEMGIDDIILYSAKTGEGRTELLRKILGE